MEPSCGFYGGIRLWSHHLVSMGVTEDFSKCMLVPTRNNSLLLAE